MMLKAPAIVDFCRAVDKPISGLIRDLKQRGMLDNTPVVFTSDGPTAPSYRSVRKSNAQARTAHSRKGFTNYQDGDNL